MSDDGLPDLVFWEEEPAKPTYEMVMPFVVVTSAGGPHDDASFVAGWRLGGLYARLAAQPETHTALLHPEDEKQADLIAMHFGYSFTTETLESSPPPDHLSVHTDDTVWRLATFTRLSSGSCEFDHPHTGHPCGKRGQWLTSPPWSDPEADPLEDVRWAMGDARQDYIDAQRRPPNAGHLPGCTGDGAWVEVPVTYDGRRLLHCPGCGAVRLQQSEDTDT